MQKLDYTNRNLKFAYGREIPTSSQRIHVSEVFTQAPCKSKCIGAFLLNPIPKAVGERRDKDQDDRGRDEPVRGCRKAGEIQRPSPLTFSLTIAEMGE